MRIWRFIASAFMPVLMVAAVSRCGPAHQSSRAAGTLPPPTIDANPDEAKDHSGSADAFQGVADCGAAYAPGHTALHLLSAEEYDRTASDLLYTSVKASALAIFEATPKGPTGFASDTEHATITDLTISKYWDAATALADDLLRSKGQPDGAYARIAACAHHQNSVPQDCYQSVARSLGLRAWRRPLTEDPSTGELARLLAIMNGSGSFDEGLKALVQALLISPNFLFVSVTSNASTTPGAVFALDQYQLASRLSYYLWGTMPDGPLFDLAAAGKLADTATMVGQVERMVASPRAARLVDTIVNDWIGIDMLPTMVTPDLADSARAALSTETQRLVHEVVFSNSNLMTITSASYTFIDKELADLYGLPFTGADPKSFVKVDLGATPRRGVLSQGAFLLASAGSTTETRPVKRGRALAANWTCSDVPPPPPNVPPLSPGALPPNSTPKQVLSVHTKSPACAACHKVLDPLGIGLESFDAYGRWRTTYPALANVPIDASGTLADGTEITNTADMVRYLASSPTVKACMARKMMEMAISRPARSTDDQCVAKANAASAMAEGAKFSDLVKAVVLSRQFGLQTGEAP